MSELFYSKEEIIEFTKETKPYKQIRWLKEQNYRFVINPGNKPVVFKNQVKDKYEEDGLILPSKQIR